MIFEIPGKPQGKARARTFYNPRIGRSQSVTPVKTKLYENWIKQCFLEKYGNLQIAKDIPLEVYIDAYFEIPKSTSKKNREKILTGELMPCKKPDADNIGKVICDALNGIAYYDDAQIVKMHITKKYTESNARVLVGIYKFEKEETKEIRHV